MIFSAGIPIKVRIDRREEKQLEIEVNVGEGRNELVQNQNAANSQRATSALRRSRRKYTKGGKSARFQASCKLR